MNSTYEPKKCNQVVIRADDDLVEKLRFLSEYYGESKTTIITDLIEEEYFSVTSTLFKFV